MCTLTIDEIDEDIVRKIDDQAERLGMSRTELARQIFESAVKTQEDKRKRFAQFCGMWTEQEAVEFDEATKDLATVDPKDWA